MENATVVTHTDCPARRVPSGELVTIPAGEFVNVKQSLGGNFTVTWRGNMLRIDGTDAAAIGQTVSLPAFEDDGSGQVVEQQVWDALDSIYDPEIPISLVSLGLIYGVDINRANNAVEVRMTLTAPGCGMGPVLVSDVKYRVSKVPNVSSVVVDLVFDPPWSRDMMSEEAQLESGMFF